MTAIIIIFYNNPSFLLAQHQHLKAFCTDRYELLVVDNSTDTEAIKAIKYHSDRLGLKYLKTNATSRNGSDSHAFAANLAYQKYQPLYDVLMFLDHDCFSVKSFSPSGILGQKNLMAGLGQQENKYYWPGCLIVHNSVPIDFTPRDGMDTGAGTSKAILSHPDACIFFNETYEQNPYFNKSQYNFYALINNGMFFHFINGSNWNNSAENEERLNSLINVLQEVASNNLKKEL